MKMNVAVFVGALVVLAGISILLEALFHIRVPLVRSGISLVLIFAGVKLLISAWRPRAETSSSGIAVMGDQRFTPSRHDGKLKYDVVFGRGLIDLTALPPPTGEVSVEVNVVFGAASIRVDPRWSVEVDGNSAFAAVRMPDLTSANFGGVHYRSKGKAEAAPTVRLLLNCVFGACDVQEGPPAEVGAHATAAR